MVADYRAIQERSTKVYDRNRALFLKEVGLYGRMAELILGPTAEVPPKWEFSAKWIDDVRTAMQLVIARLFGDFEAAKYLILHGLCDQMHMPLRDSTECMMLIRLFRRDSKKAQDWILELKQYPADQVRDWLSELGEKAPEYELYSRFSQRSHPNLLGLSYRVEEVIEQDSSVESRIIHYGAYPNNEWTALSLKGLLVTMYWSLAVVLPLIYVPFMADPEKWRSGVQLLRSELHELDSNMWQKPSSGEGNLSALTKRQISVARKRLGIERLERMLSG